MDVSKMAIPTCWKFHSQLSSMLLIDEKHFIGVIGFAQLLSLLLLTVLIALVSVTLII